MPARNPDQPVLDYEASDHGDVEPEHTFAAVVFVTGILLVVVVGMLAVILYVIRAI